MRKYHVEGTLNIVNIRLEAKCYLQKEWIDYFDTYAPIARIILVRILH